ncbi:MAG: UDP-3-O-(3-hydroxymyristoyl)glucosamine N-acyltransferase [Bacteroidetes bacterium]|nr:UDP-3-O-(3-hydroxymyristoyl)glucosamine N-acyltransferase [Bacteroidota bacterium]
MRLNPVLTVAQLAQMLQCPYAGNANQEVCGINEIHRVVPGDVTFVDHPKYYAKAINSAATTIIINKEIEVPDGKSILIHLDPFAAYNFLVARFFPAIHSTAMVDPSAKIGSNCVIHPNVSIGANAIIGDNTVLHSGVVVYHNCRIGNNCIIHANTVIGADAFYYKKREVGYDKMLSGGDVCIMDNVEIGALCTIDRGVSATTYIGTGTKFDNHVHIGHDSILGRNVLIAAFGAIAGVTTIEDEVIIWGQAGINKDLTIGKGTVVLAQSGVGTDTAPGEVVFGSPAINAREKMKEVALLKQLVKQRNS